jgi:hypothetical protein
MSEIELQIYCWVGGLCTFATFWLVYDWWKYLKGKR